MVDLKHHPTGDEDGLVPAPAHAPEAATTVDLAPVHAPAPGHDHTPGGGTPAPGLVQGPARGPRAVAARVGPDPPPAKSPAKALSGSKRIINMLMEDHGPDRETKLI